MSQYPQAKFLQSSDLGSPFPTESAGEVAFVGRSNAGKSSVINAIVNRRQFARTSKTPGRTQLINFFQLNDEHTLVDLPGYGFARVSEAKRSGWGRLVTAYLAHRKSLGGVFLIVDIRRGLVEGDERMLELAASFELPVHVLLNKADKLKRGPASAALHKVLNTLDGRATAQSVSALKRTGIDEARAVLAHFLAGNPIEAVKLPGVLSKRPPRGN